ncbi:MAG: exo-beta-N-acetylmuramidase NamZ family protein [Salibacteraceae bacterium]
MEFKKAFLLIFCVGIILQNGVSQNSFDSSLVKTAEEVLVGAERASLYIDQLKGKNVALVVNPTSEVFGTHLVDFLIEKNISISKVFAPEHGFRGTADAGERIKDGVDSKTQIPIKSLYGSFKKPSKEDLKDIDIVVFDIQDVGVRFYTYISTMHYVMEACAENNVDFMVLDRPNPNGFYVAGPVLEIEQRSFVGMHTVPIVHGMTIGEFAQMINQEGWLKNGVKCNLQVVLLTGWTHKDLYQLPVKPSPNLPNMTSVYLYPTLGLFEGTNVSAGRGTSFPFQTFGSPTISPTEFFYVPESKPGAKYPKYKNQKCFGKDLRSFQVQSFYNKPTIQLEHLYWAYNNTSNKGEFFLKNHFYGRLAGNTSLQTQIENAIKIEEVKSSWVAGLSDYKEMRKKYLLYKDF